MCVPAQSQPQDRSSGSSEIEAWRQSAIRKATWRLVPLLTGSLPLLITSTGPMWALRL
jgi:hypothetical protein